MNLGKSTPEDVRWAYRLLLEREPDSDRQVLDIVRSEVFVHELAQMVLGSQEYEDLQVAIRKLASNA